MNRFVLAGFVIGMRARFLIMMIAFGFGMVGKSGGVKSVFVSGIGFGVGQFLRSQLDDGVGFFAGMSTGGFGFRFGGPDFLEALFFGVVLPFGLSVGVGLLFLLVILFAVGIIVEFSATDESVGGSGGLNLVVLGFDEAGGEGVDVFLAERSFGASLFGRAGIEPFVARGG